MPFNHPDSPQTPGSMHAPLLPTPRPPHPPSDVDPDIEMLDIANERRDLPQVEPTSNPPLPGQPIGSNRHGTDGQDDLDGLLGARSHRSLSDSIIIDLDTDSDSSDDEGDNRPSRRQEPASPPDVDVRNDNQNENEPSSRLF